jgi:hypothetical protein
MRYAQLISLVTLATFAASSTVAAVCIALSWLRLAPAVAAAEPKRASARASGD